MIPVLIAAVLAAATAVPSTLGAVSATDPDRLVLPAPKAGHVKRLAVVVADNRGAETTDFVIPYGVLKDSGAFEVRSLSTGPGPVQLMLAIRIKADQTLAAFDASAPEGADVVIVPAQLRPKDPVLKAWIQAQAAKGATVVSICDGVMVLANAGLLEGRRATGHWTSLKGLQKQYPAAVWVRDRRYVQDDRIISTTGVSASIPASLALVEAAAGTGAARAEADRLGVNGWSAAHRTADFKLTASDYARAGGAMIKVWGHETVEIPIAAGDDEVALALRADVWTRTFKTKVVTTNPGHPEIRSLHGLTILADANPQPGRYVVPGPTLPAARQLDVALDQIERRYGAPYARLAEVGLEYDRRRSPALPAADR